MKRMTGHTGSLGPDWESDEAEARAQTRVKGRGFKIVCRNGCSGNPLSNDCASVDCCRRERARCWVRILCVVVFGGRRDRRHRHPPIGRQETVPGGRQSLASHPAKCIRLESWHSQIELGGSPTRPHQTLGPFLSGVNHRVPDLHIKPSSNHPPGGLCRFEMSGSRA